MVTAADAGSNGSIAVCDVGGAISLFAQLGGAPQAGGAWSGPSAVVGGQYDPATMTPGVYTYTITGTAPCTNATATVTVTETTAADAGTDGAITLCSNGVATGLFAQLGGSPDAGGTLDALQRRGAQRHLHPGHRCGGVYTYTLAAQAPCPG